MSGTAPTTATTATPWWQSVFSKPLRLLMIIFVLAFAGMGIYHAWRTNTTTLTSAASAPAATPSAASTAPAAPAAAPAVAPAAPAPAASAPATAPPPAPSAGWSDSLAEWLSWGGNLIGANWLAAAAAVFLIFLFGTMLWYGMKSLIKSAGGWFTTSFAILALAIGSLTAADYFLSGGRHTTTLWQGIVAGWNNTTLPGSPAAGGVGSGSISTAGLRVAIGGRSEATLRHHQTLVVTVPGTGCFNATANIDTAQRQRLPATYRGTQQVFVGTLETSRVVVFTYLPEVRNHMRTLEERGEPPLKPTVSVSARSC